MVADPTVVGGALIVLAVAVILAVVVGRFDAAPFVAAVLGSIALGLLVLADSVILFYVVNVQPNNKLLFIALLLVLLPGLGALFAAVLTLIGVLADLIWCLRHRRFGGWGFPLMLAALTAELVGIVLITGDLAGAAFMPPLANNTIEAIAVACMTLAALGFCVGAFVTLHGTRARRLAGSIAPPGRYA